MAKQFKDKVAALKAIVSGQQSFEILRPPKTFIVLQRTNDKGEAKYEHNREEMNEKDYKKWYAANVREDMDHVIMLMVCKSGERQEETTILEIHQEPIQAREEPVRKKERAERKDKEEAAVEPVIEPQLRPLSEHIRFNNYVFEKLFS
jgi:hypothetical protein